MHYRVKKMVSDTVIEKIHYKVDGIMTHGFRFPNHALQHHPHFSLTVATEGIPRVGQVRVLHGGALLLLESLAWGGGSACDVGGAEALLRLLGGGAQRLPRHLQAKQE